MKKKMVDSNLSDILSKKSSDPSYFESLLGQKYGENQSQTTTKSLGAFGGNSLRGGLARNNPLSGILGFGKSSTKGNRGGFYNSSGIQGSGGNGKYLDDQGDALPDGSFRANTAKNALEGIAPKTLGEIPKFNLTDYTSQGGIGNSTRIGGNQYNFDYQYGDNPAERVAQSGIFGGEVSDNSGTSGVSSTYNLNKPYEFGGETERTFENPAGQGFGSTSDQGVMSAHLSNPQSFKLNNTINQYNAGSGSSGGEVTTLGAGGSGNASQGQETSDLQNYGGAALDFFLNRSMLPKSLKWIDPGALAAEYLTTALFGSPTTITKDYAKANAASGQNVNNDVQLNAPGEFNLNRESNTNAQSQSVSPIFGNTAQVDASTGVNSQLGLKTDVGGTAQGATQSDLLGSGSSVIQQTNLDRKGGLFVGGLDEEQVKNQDAVATSANTGAGLTLQGTVPPELSAVFPNFVQAQGEANQQSNVSVQNQTNSEAAGQHNYGQDVTTSENVSGQVGGGAGANIGAGNTITTLAQGVDQQAKADTQAKIDSTMQGLGAYIDGMSKARAILSGQQGSDSQAVAQIHAQRFIDNLETSLPQSADSAQIISQLRQNPELAWLFDGSNSPQTVLKALASVAQTTGTTATEQSVGKGTDPVYKTLTKTTPTASLTIDPNATQGMNRYYDYDPTPQKPSSGDERKFANVQGQVQEIKNGQIVPISYRDAFDLQSLASSQVADTAGNFGHRTGAHNDESSDANRIPYGSDLGGLAPDKGITSYNNSGAASQDTSPATYDSRRNSATKEIDSLVSTLDWYKHVAQSPNQADPEVVYAKKQVGWLPTSIAAKQQQLKDLDSNFQNLIASRQASSMGYTPQGAGLAAQASLGAKGNIYGNQYFFGGSDDSIYNALASETVARSQNQYQNGQNNQTQAYIDQINAAKGQNLTAQDKEALNNLIGQRQTSSQGQLVQLNEQKTGLTNQLNDAYNQFEQYRTSGGNDPTMYQNLLGRAQEASAQLQAITDQLGGIDTEIDYNDVLGDYAATQQGRNFASKYDQSGNAYLNNRSVADYDNLLGYYNKEKAFDDQYGLSQGGNYVNLDSLTGSTRSVADAAVLGSLGWDDNYTAKASVADSYLDPVTGQLKKVGDSNMANWSNLTTNQNLAGITDRNIYNPLNISLSGTGTYNKAVTGDYDQHQLNQWRNSTSLAAGLAPSLYDQSANAFRYQK